MLQVCSDVTGYFFPLDDMLFLSIYFHSVFQSPFRNVSKTFVNIALMPRNHAMLVWSEVVI